MPFYGLYLESYEVMELLRGLWVTHLQHLITYLTVSPDTPSRLARDPQLALKTRRPASHTCPKLGGLGVLDLRVGLKGV